MAHQNLPFQIGGVGQFLGIESRRDGKELEKVA